VKGFCTKANNWKLFYEAGFAIVVLISKVFGGFARLRGQRSISGLLILRGRF